jgi:hypothetical protein
LRHQKHTTATRLLVVREFFTFEDCIAHHGGIMSRAELLSAGWTAHEVRIGVQYGWLHRLCRGWYGSLDLPAPVRASWAHGGPLACVSALEYLGAIRPDGTETPPHVCRPSRGHRLRYSGAAIVHWSDADANSGDRWCVSREAALRQAARCAPERLPEGTRNSGDTTQLSF